MVVFTRYDLNMNSEKVEHAANLFERLARLIQGDAYGAGLKPVQWEALRYLARANRFSRTPSALTAYLGSTKGTVSQTLNALVRKGLVEKTQDHNDRRVVYLSLTDTGEQLLKEDSLQRLRQAIGEIDDDRLPAFTQDLERVLYSHIARNKGRAFKQCRTCRFFRETPDAESPFRCGALDVPLSTEDSLKICAEQEDAA